MMSSTVTNQTWLGRARANGYMNAFLHVREFVCAKHVVSIEK